ncbi:MAG: hypothetical protein NTV01_08805 [Bacteroidia bacterium]|nr:hypothetical protein [Bacteroidia bacterium]
MNKFLPLVITAILIFCNPVKAQRTIRIHEKSDEKVTYSQIFKSAKLVKLETRPECLIGGKSSVRVDKDQLTAMAKAASEDDNPILVFYTYKE